MRIGIDLGGTKILGAVVDEEGTIISNLRHFAALQKTAESLERVMEGMENNISGDFLAMDIRQGMHYLGEITGEIEVDRDILGSIFGKFCIGK